MAVLLIDLELSRTLGNRQSVITDLGIQGHQFILGAAGAAGVGIALDAHNFVGFRIVDGHHVSLCNCLHPLGSSRPLNGVANGLDGTLGIVQHSHCLQDYLGPSLAGDHRLGVLGIAVAGLTGVAAVSGIVDGSSLGGAGEGDGGAGGHLSALGLCLGCSHCNPCVPAIHPEHQQVKYIFAGIIGGGVCTKTLPGDLPCNGPGAAGGGHKAEGAILVVGHIPSVGLLRLGKAGAAAIAQIIGAIGQADSGSRCRHRPYRHICAAEVGPVHRHWYTVNFATNGGA